MRFVPLKILKKRVRFQFCFLIFWCHKWYLLSERRRAVRWEIRSKLASKTMTSFPDLGSASSQESSPQLAQSEMQDIIEMLMNRSTRINGLLRPTTYSGYTGCWMQQVTVPTLAVTCQIQQATCVFRSACKWGLRPPLVQEDSKMHAHSWIQQVIARVCAVPRWIQRHM